jgi:hypothetical protein
MAKANSLKADNPFSSEADGVKIYFLVPNHFKLKLTNGVYATEKNIQDEKRKLCTKFNIKESEIISYDISDASVQRKFYPIYLNTSEEAQKIFDFALRKTAGKIIYDVERDYNDMIKHIQIDIYNNCRTISDYDSLVLIKNAIEAVKNETGKITVVPIK